MSRNLDLLLAISPGVIKIVLVALENYPQTDTPAGN